METTDKLIHQTVTENKSHNSPTEFADLNTDCLIEICDFFPWKDLFAFANTSKRMREAAQESFRIRKDKSIAFAFATHFNSASITNDPTLFTRALQLFIDSSPEAVLIDTSNCPIVDYLARVYGGTLKSLRIKGGVEFDPDDVHVHRLFAGLTKLAIKWSPVRLPVEKCESLEHLDISGEFSPDYFALTFPRLRNVIGQEVDEAFIFRHPSLTTVHFKGHFQDIADALVALPELHSLKVDFFDSHSEKCQRLSEFRHLKKLTLNRVSGNGLGNLLCRADALLESLEELDLWYKSEVQPDWTKFALFKALRVLEVAQFVSVNVLAKGIEFIAERFQSVHLERIIIECRFDEVFEVAARKRIDAVCKRRDIYLTIKGYVATYGEKRDEIIRSFDKYCNNYGKLILGKRV